METKKPKLMMNGHTDEIYTPKEAIFSLLPYIKKDWTIWECAWGQGALAKHFKEEGFKVIGEKNDDFLTHFLGDRKGNVSIKLEDFDCIITNPPYSQKESFLSLCYSLKKPFALLMPLTALEGKKRGELYRKYGIQLVIPNKRINFVMPNKQGGAWFQVAWFCWGFNLPKDLMFVEQKGGFSKD